MRRTLTYWYYLASLGYAIGIMTTGRNPDNAARLLGYQSTDDAQNVYASYGFIKVSADDLKLKPVPGKLNGSVCALCAS